MAASFNPFPDSDGSAPNCYSDGAVNAPAKESDLLRPTHWGFDTMGLNDNWQATDHPTVDRHII